MVSSVLSNTQTSGASTTPDGFSDLSTQEFLKIIFTELQKQDPLSPNDSSKLLEQLSSIRNIQSDLELSNKLEDVVTQNQLASASGLIGRYVSGLDDRSQRVTGEVVSVSRTQDGPVLNLKAGQRVHFDQVDQLRVEPETPSTTGSSSSTTDPAP